MGRTTRLLGTSATSTTRSIWLALRPSRASRSRTSRRRSIATCSLTGRASSCWRLAVCSTCLRHWPPVLRHVVLVHEPDPRAARALEGARQREVQDGPGVPPPEEPGREGGAVAPSSARGGAYRLDQGAGGLHRCAGWRPVQAGHIPLLVF